MTTVALIYHSGMGNTSKVADSIATGASQVAGVSVKALQITGEQIQHGRWKDDAIMAQLAEAYAIIFGAPTYMGMVSGPFKCFADATAPLWFQQPWRDKLAGGFTSSGYASGDKVMTLHYLATLAAQLRMIWVGPAAPASNITGDGQNIDRWGFYMGVGALGNVQMDLGLPDAGDLLTARLYGEGIAQTALRWQHGMRLQHQGE
ncbi:MAG: flavodoxin family protein [Chloroflexota bacterium]|nr:flavodoxin family protein [Chloroflexota bacterium]